MFIISEISPQFGGDLNVAEQMILQSKMGGASAAKIQLYPHDLFERDDGQCIKYRELSFDDFKRLKLYGDKIGLPVFGTAFTDDRLDWCIELKQEYYKVAARQHRENPELVARTIGQSKPTFVSVPHDYPIEQVPVGDNCIYLHCIVKYPTWLHEVEIPDFSAGFFDGISDHSLGIAAPLMAATHGAKYLEKHFTINHSWQKLTERAHLGSMNYEQLCLIKSISSDIDLINAGSLKRSGVS